MNNGKWTNDEHNLFVKAVLNYKKNWKKVS